MFRCAPLARRIGRIPARCGYLHWATLPAFNTDVPDHPDPARALADLIDQRSARVAVIGLGYVGLPLLDAVAAAGFPAIGLDHDPQKIAKLGRGENYLPHLGIDLPKRLTANRKVSLSADPGVLADADVILICVPTPLDESHEPDLSAIDRAATEIRDALAGDPARPRLVVLESTTYPGTTRDMLAPILRSDRLPEVTFVAFSPEREDPGNPTHTTRTIPKLVGGIDDASTELAVRFYGAVVERVIPCRNAEIAEAAKLIENVYRAVNIALVNDLKVLLDAMGIDVWEVLEAAATKPFGFHRFDPGPGFGGHCVPIDPFYLTWRARQFGVDSRFVELAGEINRTMPAYIVEKCEAALAEERGLELGSASILVLGVAYKKNIADVRESPAFEIIRILREKGASVAYHDPHVPRTWAGRRHDLGMESVAWSGETLARADMVLIVTDHDWYDWSFIGAHARLIVDTRNAMARAGIGPHVGVRVVKA